MQEKMMICSCVLKSLINFNFRFGTGNFIRGFSEEILSSALTCTVGEKQTAAADDSL